MELESVDGDLGAGSFENQGVVEWGKDVRDQLDCLLCHYTPQD